ncbi:MAG: hypothetical protein HC890_18990 [Chloroflexaceae bacterium]|nr:hypothetical protein [Chloroflexaceae bacterium]
MTLPVFPVLLLIMAIGSTFYYLRSGNDIFSVLAIAAAVVCLIWGLVIAHWSVHLLGLLLLFSFRRPVLKAVRVPINK